VCKRFSFNLIILVIFIQIDIICLCFFFFLFLFLQKWLKRMFIGLERICELKRNSTKARALFFQTVALKLLYTVDSDCGLCKVVGLKT
jgi:hypothetical protein